MRQTPRATVLIVAGVVALTACGGGDDEPVVAVDDETSADATTDATTDATGPAATDATGPAAIAPPGVVSSEEGAAIAELASVTIIDVRTPEEFAEGHVAGAELVDLNSGRFAEAIADYDTSGNYLVYCRSGNRSAQAAGIMSDLGFEHVWDMGGIVDWQAAGYPVVS